MTVDPLLANFFANIFDDFGNGGERVFGIGLVGPDNIGNGVESDNLTSMIDKVLKKADFSRRKNGRVEIECRSSRRKAKTSKIFLRVYQKGGVVVIVGNIGEELGKSGVSEKIFDQILTIAPIDGASFSILAHMSLVESQKQSMNQDVDGEIGAIGGIDIDSFALFTGVETAVRTKRGG